MMLSSINYQIKWHDAFLRDFKKCKFESEKIFTLIKQIDFVAINSTDSLYKVISNS